MALKVLIAAACIAVLAVAGHYFWAQYQAGVEAKARADAAYCNEAIRNLEAINQGRRTPQMESKSVYEVIVRGCIIKMQGG